MILLACGFVNLAILFWRSLLLAIILVLTTTTTDGILQLESFVRQTSEQ